MPANEDYHHAVNNSYGATIKQNVSTAASNTKKATFKQPVAF